MCENKYGLQSGEGWRKGHVLIVRDYDTDLELRDC